MRLRTKFFIICGTVVLLLWALTWWPVQRIQRSASDRMAASAFAGATQTLRTVQTQRLGQMKQACTLVMNIPELRALIAESNFEIAPENIASLQERLDGLSRIVGVDFVCVLDQRGSLIAQNHGSPWASLAELKDFIRGSKESDAMLRRLFSPLLARQNQEGLWFHQGAIYNVVGMPLVFSSADEETAQTDGALIMATPITDQFACELGKDHGVDVSFLGGSCLVASSFSGNSRQILAHGMSTSAWPSSRAFDFSIGDVRYRSWLEPLVDRASGNRIGSTLIQSSLAEAEADQLRASRSLLLVMLSGLAVAAVISYLLSGAITRPLSRLVSGVKAVAAGNLDLTLPAKQRDELGELSGAFNDMVGQLRARHELQRLVDQSQAATKAKSQFLANMSHEIRTPLHGVIGMANLLLSGELDERQRHYAELVKSSAEVLTTLINDILDFSKIEAGKLELESTEFDVRAVLEDVVELLAQKAFGKCVEMACQVGRDVPIMAHGDANRLRQILMNLVGNAVKFTDQGEIIVRATLAGAKDGGVLVRFDIADTGPGIPPDRLERLFKSFSQVDASTTRRYGGTGLGLAISKQLAELMGGEVGVESALGKGSTFWFTIALRPLDCCPANPPRELAGLNTLVVHPSPVVQEILREELTRAGAIARSASTGAEAAELLRTTQDTVPVGIVLVDRNVSDWATVSVPESSKQVLLTMPADDLPAERLKSLGFAASVIKPVRPVQLLGVIARLLSPEFAGFAEKKNPQPQIPSAATRNAYRILLAEDNQINQIVASELLSRAGYGVEIVADGQAALAAYGKSGFDLVLMDCQMPVMDGLEATRAIRGLEEESARTDSPRRRVPIIALTANASSVDRERCIEAGMDGYFQKPFRPRDLLQAVTRYLNEFAEPTPRAAPPPPGSPTKSSTTIGSVKTAQSAIATSTLLESSSGNAQLAITILLRFEKQVNAAAAEFVKCVDSKDGEALARLSHSLKGTAGLIGAEPLREILAKMEQVGRAGVFESADKDLQQLRCEIDRCAAAAAEVHTELMALTC